MSAILKGFMKLSLSSSSKMPTSEIIYTEWMGWVYSYPMIRSSVYANGGGKKKHTQIDSKGRR